MGIKEIIAGIDTQIAKLQQARSLLAGSEATSPKRRGRPKGATEQAPMSSSRNLSPEGRKRIADAMKRRWAARKKESGR